MKTLAQEGFRGFILIYYVHGIRDYLQEFHRHGVAAANNILDVSS